MILDDDEPLRTRLGRALTTRGFDVVLAGSIAAATAIVKSNPPAFAVLDMRLDDGSGLDIVTLLHECRPDCRTLMLTGYGNLATAVVAVKSGAVDYLAKPADADDVCKALLVPSGDRPCRQKTLCLQIAYGGNIYSGSMICVITMYRKRRGA